MKPLLAVNAELDQLRFPVFASPKLDGVRCLIINGVAMSRNMKPIPNRRVQQLFGHSILNGLDGELIVGDPTAPDCYSRTMSGVMSEAGEPEVTFMVFDALGAGPKHSFQQRLQHAGEYLAKLSRRTLMLVPHAVVNGHDELSTFEARCVSAGYEGIMLRDPLGIYKFGRSTVKEGILLKVKRFEDSEAVILSSYEQLRNENEATRDELGRTKRSSHAAGKVGKGVLGGFSVRDLKSGVEFDVGTGFTDADRVLLGGHGLGETTLAGRVIKYKFQPAGVKDKPRFPVYLGFRDERDL